MWTFTKLLEGNLGDKTKKSTHQCKNLQCNNTSLYNSPNVLWIFKNHYASSWVMDMGISCGLPIDAQQRIISILLIRERWQATNDAEKWFKQER